MLLKIGFVNMSHALILGFHLRDICLDNGCYPPSLCSSNVNKQTRRDAKSTMVHCIVVECGSKSGKHAVKFACIPKVITNQGEEHEELTRERRRQWISAISRGDTDSKRILESERVCSRHFITGKAACVWDKYNIDWVPTQNLGKKEFKDINKKERELSEANAREKRVKDRRKRAIEQQEIETAKKRKELDQTGNRARDISFSEATTSSSMDLNNFDTVSVDELSLHVDEATQTEVIEFGFAMTKRT